MIPQKDLNQLIQYYKGELTENAFQQSRDAGR